MLGEKSSNNTVTLTAIGDVLLHGRVYGGIKKTSNYKFLKKFKSVQGLLGKTDLTVANLETPIAGIEIGLSSFPKFNAPAEIGGALKDMGVDLVTIANNHILDRGEEGLLKSIANLEKIGLEYDGAYKSAEDKRRLRIFERNGLKVCFVSYTQGTNGIKLPADKPYMVNSLKKVSVLKLSKELRSIKSENLADIIVVNMHFGEEYHLYPSHRQREIAASLADAGADVILGHHSHVLQSPEWIETSMGTKTFVAYSLGNFISGQNGLHRQIGGALHLDISRPDPNYKGVHISNPRFDLTYVEKEKRLRYGIHLFKDWVKDNKTIVTDYGEFSSEKVYNDTIARMRKEIADLDVN